jgi:hypothetical protein
MLDLDGALIDMRPFAHELESADRSTRWYRFFGHTPEAKPVSAGAALVRALDRIGWRYSISTTRPRYIVGKTPEGKRFAPQLPMINYWLATNVEHQPKRFRHLRPPGPTLSQISVKLAHIRAARCAVFVDDDIEVVEALTDHGVTALHVEDFDGMSDSAIKSVLDYAAQCDRGRNTASPR